jgi:Oligoendopeptidase F
VGESAQTLAGLLEFEKALEQKMERVYHYASLQAAEDSTNNEYLARIGQVQNLLTRISEAAAFVVRKFWRSMMNDSENSLPIRR